MESQQIRTSRKPTPTLARITNFVEKYWNISVTKIRQIDSYDDANFYCEGSLNGIHEKYLIKVFNSLDTEHPELLNALLHMLSTINGKINSDLKIPKVVPAGGHPDSALLVMKDCEVYDGSFDKVVVRLYQWIDGTTLSSVAATPPHFLQTGRALGEIYTALIGFDDASFHRTHMWDLAQFDIAYPLHSYVDDHKVGEVIQSVYSLYHLNVLPVSTSLHTSIIMGDCNDANIIVSAEDNSKVVGLIDFSDAVHTWAVNEIAIAIAYSLITSFGLSHPYEALAALLIGYSQLRPLTDLELDVLPILIATRLSISISVGAYSISKNPENEYLKLHAMPARTALVSFWSIPRHVHVEFMREVQAVSSRESGTEFVSALIAKHYDAK